MYLTELDSKTGLIKIEGQFDGVMAIREFRELVNNPDYGIKALTAVALTVDYLTIIKHYKEEDRPYKAMGNVCDGNRRAFIWNSEPIQQALIKYDNLQYNATIEEKKALDFMLLKKLDEIKKETESKPVYGQLDAVTPENIKEVLEENSDVRRLLREHEWDNLSELAQKSMIRKANQQVIDPYNKKLAEKQAEVSQEKVLNLFKQLNTIKSLIENFNKQNEDKDIYADGIVVNNYRLSRLEEKQLDKNSFYNK